MNFTLRSRKSLKPFAMFALALGVMTFATVGPPATAPAAAATPAGIAALAQANVGKGAGWCSLVNNSPNSLGGTSFYSSCSGYAGLPEYWCADFAKWVWANSGVNVAGITAGAGSFITAAGTNGSTVHTSSSYVPQLGDAVVFGWDGVSSATHVGIVVQRNSGGSIVVANGDFSGDKSVGEAYFAKTATVVNSTIAAGSAHVGGSLSAFVTPSGLGASGGSSGGGTNTGFHTDGPIDFNGDGKTDVFTVSSDGQWWYSSGGVGSFQKLAMGSASTPLSQLAFGDFNGDGKTDVFTVSSDGQWWYSSGGVGSFQKLAMGSASTPLSQLAFGDFNGDRKTDVFTVSSDGQWWYSSAGVGSFQKLAMGSASTTIDGLRVG